MNSSADTSLAQASTAAVGANRDAEIAGAVRDLLAPALPDSSTGEPPVAVVDIGANPIDGDPPYRLLLDTGLCTVTGFEPQRQALAELHKLAGVSRALLAVRRG